MSNKLFQDVIQQMKGTVDRAIGVIDDTGVIISCSDLKKIGICSSIFSFNGIDLDNSFVKDGYTYKFFASSGKFEYAAFAEGIDDTAHQLSNILAVSFSNIKNYFDEKYDCNNFIKNVVLDNILPGDIFVKARELRFSIDAEYVALLIRTVSNGDVYPYDVVQNLFPNKKKDFIFNTNENDIVLIKKIDSDITSKDLEKLARSIVDVLSGEFCTRTMIGIGTSVVGVSDLARSFKEAQVALEVGKVFDTDKVIVSYDNLGIARLIYQLPITLCETFLKEVFKSGSIELLDQETLFTIQKFFENNLNVSETSRKLFVHRNTLVYRLEKIRKITGLDLRDFDDAIIFKIAMMVKKYLASNPTKI